jgi:hypothetical protein
MSNNIHPNTTIIELGEKSGSTTQTYQEVVGTTSEVTFNGCIDVGNTDQAPNLPYKQNYYSGSGYSGFTGIGNANIGCSLQNDASNRFDPGGNKLLILDLSGGVATSGGVFFANDVDTSEIYDQTQGWTTIKFQNPCSYPNNTLNLSNYFTFTDSTVSGNPTGNHFTAPYDNLKVSFSTQVYTNGVTPGSSNANNISFRLRLRHYKANTNNYQNYEKLNSNGTPDVLGTNYNTPCNVTNGSASSHFGVIDANTQQSPLGDSNITLQSGDKLWIQILITQAALETKLCDGVGLGLTQSSSNCITGMGTRNLYSLDTSGIVGSSPQFQWSGNAGMNFSGISGLYTPDNQMPNDEHSQGRSLYFLDQTNMLSSQELKNSTLIFDIVSGLTGDDSKLIVKGTGGDQLSQLIQDVPNLNNFGSDTYQWYVSAYQHGGNWNSKGNNLSWNFDAEDKTRILSYEGEAGQKRHHSVYDTLGELGLRSKDFEGNVDYYEIEIDVASCVNSQITVFESPSSTGVINANPRQPITSAGIYTYCLTSLTKTNIWGGASDGSNSGKVWMTNGFPSGAFSSAHYYFANGSIKVLDAEKVGSSGNHSIVINSIKLKKMEPDITTTIRDVYGGSFDYEVDNYNWEKIDVMESNKVPLSLTFQASDLHDISKRTAGYSKTFNIPASHNNETILGNMLAVGVQRQKISWEKARIKSNGVIVFAGLMRIEQGVTGKGGYYKCHIIEDTIDWSQAIGDRELCDISIAPRVPELKNRDNIINSWSQNKPYDFDRAGVMGSGAKQSEDYFWGIANYGDWHRFSINTSQHKYSRDLYDFHPVVYAKKVVQKIFRQAGYTLKSDFWNSITASLLVHPFGSGANYYQTDPALLTGDSGNNVAHASLPGSHACLGNYQSGGKIPAGGYGRTWYPVLNVTTDVNSLVTGIGTNTWGGSSTYGYVVPFTGQYVVNFKGGIRTSHNIASAGSEIKATCLLNGQTLLYQGGQPVQHQTTQDVLSVFDMPVLKNLNAGDIISYKITGTNSSSTFPCWQDAENLEILCYPDSGTTAPAQFTNFAEVLKCGTKQIDYIKGFTEMFNLQWTSNNQTKIVECEPYDDFYGSGKVLDWTEKLDQTSWNDKFIIEELAKKVTWKYNQDSGDEGLDNLYEWRENNNYDIYKSHTQTNEEKFRKEEMFLGTDVFSATWRFNNYGTQSNPHQHGPSHPFAPNSYGWGDMTWTSSGGSVTNNPLMPVIWMGEGGRINGDFDDRPDFNMFPSSELRVVNYYSLLNGVKADGSGDKTQPSVTSCRNWGFFETNNQIQNSYPFMDWIDGYKKGNSIDPYCLSWGDYDDGLGNVSPGLFSKYWKTAYNKMNGGAALRTCKMNLNQNDIASFDYKDIIKLEIDNVPTYWTINKITDYKPNQEVLTTVELIEYKEKVQYGNIKTNKGTGTKHIPFGTIEREDNSARKSLKKITNKNNVTKGSGIAIGDGIIANNSQTVVGSYNEETPNAIFSVGIGTSNEDRHTAFSIDSCGEMQVQGGSLIVEEEDGVVHDLVFTEENTNEDGTTESSIKKVYLKKNK